MIGELFKALLITSLAGSVLTVVISLLRPITKKIFGYSWHYYIWLALPVSTIALFFPDSGTYGQAHIAQTASSAGAEHCNTNDTDTTRSCQ